MKKIILFICLLSMANLIASNPCGCGSMSGGSTMEFTIATPEGAEPNCCKDKAIGVGYVFTWKHQGGGVYLLIASEEIAVGGDLQKKCCENA